MDKFKPHVFVPALFLIFATIRIVAMLSSPWKDSYFASSLLIVAAVTLVLYVIRNPARMIECFMVGGLCFLSAILVDIASHYSRQVQLALLGSVGLFSIIAALLPSRTTSGPSGSPEA